MRTDKINIILCPLRQFPARGEMIFAQFPAFCCELEHGPCKELCWASYDSGGLQLSWSVFVTHNVSYMYRVQYRPSYQSWERVLVLVTSMMVLRIFGRFFIFERVLFCFFLSPTPPHRTGSRNLQKCGFGPAAGEHFWGILRFRVKHPLVSQGGKRGGGYCME